MKKNNILLLLCMEGNESNTEKRLIEPFTNVGFSDIKSEYFSKCSHNDSELPNRIKNKLNRLFSHDVFHQSDLTIECYIFSDGDLNNGHWLALEKTYILTKEYIESYFSNSSKWTLHIHEHFYDKGKRIEDFIWLLLPSTTSDKLNNPIKSKEVEHDLMRFYQIDNINRMKEENFGIWKPFIEYYKVCNNTTSYPNLLEVVRFILNSKSSIKSCSKYFELLEAILKYYDASLNDIKD